MSVTVNEVQVNTTVNEASGPAPAQKAGGKQGANGGAGMSAEDKEKLIDECLARVRDLLEELKER